MIVFRFNPHLSAASLGDMTAERGKTTPPVALIPPIMPRRHQNHLLLPENWPGFLRIRTKCNQLRRRLGVRLS